MILSKKYNYVYRITNTKENKHYIGVHSSNIEPALDFGIKYKGTSKDFDFMQDQKDNPQDYVYQILEYFATREEALLREMYLHELYNADLNESFYNIRKQSSTTWDNTGNRKIAKKISKANKGRICINDGKNNKYIKSNELEKYLNDGWIKGGLPRSEEAKLNYKSGTTGKTTINNGKIEIFVEKDEVDEYRILGFTEGRLPMKDISKFKLSLAHSNKVLTVDHRNNIGKSTKGVSKSQTMKDNLSETRTGMIYINNSNTEKIINPSDVNEYLEYGWILGKLPMPKSHRESISKNSIGKPGTTTGKIFITNSFVEKAIFKEELDDYILAGWIKGRKPLTEETKSKLKGRKGSTAGKIGINNGVSNKFINSKELDYYISIGFIKGLKSNKKQH